MTGVLLTLPLPVPVNSMYIRGRIKSPRYRAWCTAAGWQLKTQKPSKVTGPYKVLISLPKTRGDVDGRIKGILDLLVTHGVTDDDRHCVFVSAHVLPEHPKGCCTVSVEPVRPAEQWKPWPADEDEAA